ncbi:MAG: ATP-dependent helicase HrpB [Mycobacterium leprae]
MTVGDITVPLPIEPILPRLSATLATQNAAVLVAPPGAGKSTRVPLALLNEPWLRGQRILLLEPRRLAARSAARYMAQCLDEPVGETVGYRVRLDSKVSPRTRVEVITEGVLTRLLQSDPALEGVGLVIFDEFHERSLQADLGLALSLQSQSLLREDLRLLVMSATLEAEAVAALLSDAPVIVSEGRSYPVETRYLPLPVTGRVEPVVVRTILDSLRQEPGDLLIFLPGAGEIRRVEAELRSSGLGPDVRIAPLYGNLSTEAQDTAILPSPTGSRKVVLATAIAQTSLTVEGVRVVIDSGLMRLPRFSPRTGMTRLETVPVSRAAADQRRGRAGRVAPGICYRLWPEQADRHLLPQSPPEILAADLLPLALELAIWGVPDPQALRWLDPPPAAAMSQARTLLQELGALSRDGSVTPHGRQMAELGLHPRLAHMLLRAIPLGHGALACELAALLSERDIFRNDALAPDADLRLRVLALRGVGDYAVDTGA